MWRGIQRQRCQGNSDLLSPPLWLFCRAPSRPSAHTHPAERRQTPQRKAGQQPRGYYARWADPGNRQIFIRTQIVKVRQKKYASAFPDNRSQVILSAETAKASLCLDLAPFVIYKKKKTLTTSWGVHPPCCRERWSWQCTPAQHQRKGGPPQQFGECSLHDPLG